MKLRPLLLLLLLLPVLVASPALAATPDHIPVQGVLTGQDGGPVADGAFAVRFALYEAEEGGTPVWLESWPPNPSADCNVDATGCLDVTGGVFSAELGRLVPLTVEIFRDTDELWLGISVADDPELSRRALGAHAMAYIAAYSTEAAYAAESAYAAQSAYAADSAYAAEAAVALALDCSGCIPESALAFEVGGDFAPVGHGLDEVSGGLVTNTFDTVFSSTDTPVPNNPLLGTAVSTLTLADVGEIEDISIAATIAHGDLGEITLTLTGPDGTSVTLYAKDDPGVADLAATWTTADALPFGALSSWIGKEAGGDWVLTMTDLTVGNEGTILTWSVEVRARSQQEVGINADLNLNAHQLKFARLHLSDGPPAPCGSGLSGLIYFDTALAEVRVCTGDVWASLNDNCGDGEVGGSEGCDDGGTTSGDGCDSSCQVEPGWTCDGPACDPVCGDGVVLGDEECDVDDPCTCDAQCQSLDATIPVDFTWSPEIPSPLVETTFTAITDGTDHEWTFELGSPGSSTAAGPSVEWGIIGDFEVTLTVLSNGCASTATRVVSVVSQPSGFESFAYTGSIVTWTVPPNVSTVTAIAIGANGGSFTGGNAGGRGARVSATFAVQPGTVHQILVGGQGTNGDGVGNWHAGAGGGGTFFAEGAVLSTSTPLLVAGAGGGGASGGNGGDGGAFVLSGLGTGGTCFGNGDNSGTAGGFHFNGEGCGNLPNSNGKAFVNGGAGGTQDYGVFLHGGFGAGGGPGSQTGGCGGGYNGYGQISSGTPGIAGDSFWSAEAGTASIDSGYNPSGHGSFTLSW